MEFSGIVHFGDRLATLPENIVAALQSSVGAEEVVTVDWSVKVGQAVEIIEGPFQGLEVLVTHLLPAKERIRVLFEFLGRPLEIEISTAKGAGCLRHFGPQQSSSPECIARRPLTLLTQGLRLFRGLVQAGNRDEDAGTNDFVGSK